MRLRYPPSFTRLLPLTAIAFHAEIQQESGDKRSDWREHDEEGVNQSHI
jgi:hypothetical protein